MPNTKLSEVIVPLAIVIAAIGFALGYYVCSRSGTPKNLHSNNLISNNVAISMIDAHRAQAPNDPFSGHIEIGVLLSYIQEVQEQCDNIGIEFSGLEYYFANHLDSLPGSWDEGSLTTVIYPTCKSGIHHMPFDPFLSNSADTVSVSEIKTNIENNGTHGNSAHVLNRANMSPPKQPNTY